jgi:hypothetical protein
MNNGETGIKRKFIGARQQAIVQNVIFSIDNFAYVLFQNRELSRLCPFDHTIGNQNCIVLA